MTKHNNKRQLIGRQHTLGHQLIDTDHMAIAHWWQRVVQCDPVESTFFIARLKKLMRDHFDHEALLMAQSGGRLCECHQKEHQQWIDVCDQAQALSGISWRKARSLLRTDLPRLVREHVISMDQLTVMFINTNGTGGHPHTGIEGR
jgi:hemerythrin